MEGVVGEPESLVLVLVLGLVLAEEAEFYGGEGRVSGSETLKGSLD
jgi:hypothetical protein